MGSPPAAGSPRRRCCAIQGLVVLFLVYVLAVLVLAGGELFLDDQLELRFPSSPGIGSSSSSDRVLLSPRSLLLRLGEIARRGGRRWWWTTGGDTGGNRPESDSPRREGGNSSATEACSRRCAGSGQTGMALCLAKQLSAEEDGRGGGNLVFSPLSIYSALTVVTAGARGTTLTELLAALGAPSRDTLAKNAGEIVRAIPGGTAPGGPRVAQACGLWHERTRTLRPAFRETAAASFNAAARAVDFLTNPEEARKEINSWVAAATENLIDTILPPGSVSTDTRLVVASAIYFNGTWQTPFRKQNTNKDKFHLLDGGGDIEVDFMRSDRDQYVAAHDGFKVLKMPYTRAFWTHTQPPPQYSMCVFLPDECDGLWSLKDRMAAAGGEGFLREHMPEKRVRVGEFRIPRFKLSFGDSVKNALQCLGVKDVFDPAGADLSDVLEEDNSSDPPLFVWDVLHRAVIEVNEEGTEAAAATVLIEKGRARRPSPAPVPVDFVADHPFAFFVVEELSGAVLFAGHVVDPTKS